MSRTVKTIVEVTVDDDDITDVQVASLVEMMLKVGLLLRIVTSNALSSGIVSFSIRHDSSTRRSIRP